MSRRTPEHPPRGVEGGGNGEFDDLLSGELEVASLGPTTPIGFIEMVLERMGQQGLELDDYRVAAILRPAWGSREEVRKRISEMTEETFDQTYPDVYGRLIRWYIEPSPEG